MCFSDLEEDLDLAVRTIREAEDDGSATVIIVSTLLHILQKSLPQSPPVTNFLLPPTSLAIIIALNLIHSNFYLQPHAHYSNYLLFCPQPP